MITPNPELLRHHILTAGTLTALEKRYLEKLVAADQLRKACGCKCAYTKIGKAAPTAMCAKFQTYTDPVFCGFVLTLRPKKALEALKVIRETLLDYIVLCGKLRTANTENDELKRMLRLAVDDFQTAMLEEKCKVCGLEHCDYDEICKWRHHDEAMELLGGTENAEN